MEDKNTLDVDLDNEKITDDLKKEMKESETIHIHKTDDDGDEVDINIDKNKKTVNINVDNEGKNTNVNIGFSAIKVKDGEELVNIRFWPIYVFVALVICGVLFLIYKLL